MWLFIFSCLSIFHAPVCVDAEVSQTAHAIHWTNDESSALISVRMWTKVVVHNRIWLRSHGWSSCVACIEHDRSGVFEITSKTIDSNEKSFNAIRIRFRAIWRLAQHNIVMMMALAYVHFIILIIISSCDVCVCVCCQVWPTVAHSLRPKRANVTNRRHNHNHTCAAYNACFWNGSRCTRTFLCYCAARVHTYHTVSS